MAEPASNQQAYTATEEEVWEITSVMAQCGQVRGLPLPDSTKQAIAAVLGKQYAVRAANRPAPVPDYQELATRALKYRDENFPPRGSPVGYALLTEIAAVLQTVINQADERAQLIWALSFFGRFSKDCDNYQMPSRGAWLWSKLFAYDEDGEIDAEPKITDLLPDDLYLLGINHEVPGGCYSWGLPMALFRRAAEVINRTGDITQYSEAQRQRFEQWLWHGGDVPSLEEPVS